MNGLRRVIEDYLRSRGWYVDEEVAKECDEGYGDRRDSCRDFYWTLPEWGLYWRDPKTGEVSRRHVEFDAAIEATIATERGEWRGVTEERAEDWRRRL
jgi:hypothetical protein